MHTPWLCFHLILTLRSIRPNEVSSRRTWPYTMNNMSNVLKLGLAEKLKPGQGEEVQCYRSCNCSTIKNTNENITMICGVKGTYGWLNGCAKLSSLLPPTQHTGSQIRQPKRSLITLYYFVLGKCLHGLAMVSSTFSIHIRSMLPGGWQSRRRGS